MSVSRLPFRELLDSRLPSVLGTCASDVAGIAKAVNAAQERLLYCKEAGDEGWYGGYAEMVFSVSQANPYIVLPRGVARLIALNVCDTPVRLRNQFYEYLAFGSGHWPKLRCSSSTAICSGDQTQALRRNAVATFTDIGTSGKGLRAYVTDPADAGGTLRFFVGGLDDNGQALYSLNGDIQYNGIFTTFASPFADVLVPTTAVPQGISAITTIQKDITVGPVHFYEVDLTTGTSVLLLTMAPGETNAAYTRLYLNATPQGCCPTPGATSATSVEVLAMVKLDLVPVVVDTDPLLIQSAEAIIAECRSGRFADTDAASPKVGENRILAIRLLRGQLRHFEGYQQTSVDFAPFGSARLSNQAVGSLM